MRHNCKTCIRLCGTGILLLSLLLSVPARADDEPATDAAPTGAARTKKTAKADHAPPSEPADESASDSESNSESEGQAHGKAEPPTNQKAPLVEQLPGSAFPDPPRGIYGGSLWLGTFHGLQWPYVPRTGVGISGYGWVDTGYERITRGDANQPDTTYWLQQGRAVLRITPTYSDGSFFVQGQAELVANKDQTANHPDTADTDDLWVRVGSWKKWDVQAGRYEAWEVYHLGMGLDLNTLERIGAKNPTSAPPDFYGATFAYYRSSGVGNIALHLYPATVLRFELLAQAGSEGGLLTLGARPAAVFDIGWLKIKAAGEYRKSSGQDTVQMSRLDANGAPLTNPDGTPIIVKSASPEDKIERGASGSIQVLLNPYFEAGLNAGRGLVDHTDNKGTKDGPGSFTVTSFGGFANVRVVEDLLVGVGADWTTKVDLNNDSVGKVGHYANLQGFGAIQYLVAKHLFVKTVLAYARGDWDPSFDPAPIDIKYSNYMYSGRVRLLYLF